MAGSTNVEPLSDGSGARVRLPDGRSIGVRETGDTSGWPLLLLTGTPGSRLSPLPDVDATREQGARVLVVERPGFGISDPLPGRRVLDWPSDIANVADAFGMDSFAMAGMGTAGAYLAACALALPGRVRAVAMIGVFSPFAAPGVRGSMTLRRRWIHRALRLAPLAPALLRAIGVARVQQAMGVQLADCDKRILARIQTPFAAMKREAFRQGADCFALDLALAARPWGFRLEDIRVPVHLWHGDLDASAPPAMGRYLASAIPGCHTRFVAGEGHMLAYSIWPEVLRTLAPTRAARAAAAD